MLKPIRPGRLRGMTDAEIACCLSGLFETDVDYVNGEGWIRCPDVDSPNALLRECDRLRNVAGVAVGCDRRGVYVHFVFNQRALEIIHQQANSLEPICTEVQ